MKIYTEKVTLLENTIDRHEKKLAGFWFLTGWMLPFN